MAIPTGYSYEDSAASKLQIIPMPIHIGIPMAIPINAYSSDDSAGSKLPIIPMAIPMAIRMPIPVAIPAASKLPAILMAILMIIRVAILTGSRGLEITDYPSA